MIRKQLVTIIIPTYNRANLIGDTLNSVQAQSYQNWECIIVDDGSKDKTKNVVASFIADDKRFSLYSRPDTRKKGPSACRNIGIEKALGEFVVFLDSDDLLSISCLENRVSYCQANQNLDFVVFSMAKFKTLDNLQTDKKEVVFHGQKQDLVKLFLVHKYPWNTTRPIYKKKFIESVGGFNESLLILEDPELALRCLLTTECKYESVDFIDCYYRQSEDHEKKYKNRTFLLNFMQNLINQKKEVFNLMDGKSHPYLNELKYELIKFILIFIGKDYKFLKQELINVYYKNISFSFFDKFLIYLLIISKKNINKKGMYRLTKKIELFYRNKTILNKIIF